MAIHSGEKNLSGSTFWEKNIIDSKYCGKNMIGNPFWEKNIIGIKL